MTLTRTRARTRRGAALLVLVGFGSCVALSALVTSPAAAAAPDQQGWWWTLNQGSVPEVGQPAPPPSPPDVPAKGMLVEGPAGSPAGAAPSAPVGGNASGSAPVAYAALVYYLPVGGTASVLALHVAANSASTPTATLELCPLVNPVMNPEQGGPSADAPPYDCTHNVSAAPSAGGTTYQFQVGDLVTDGALAVAILPTSPTDRVVLDQPGASSLTEQAPPAGSGAVPQTTSPSTGGTQSPAFGTSFAGSVPTFATPPFDATTPSPATGSPPAAPAPPAAASPAAASPRPYSAVPVLGVFNGDNASPLTVALVCAGLLGGAALWFMAGRRRADEGALAEVAVTD